MTGLVKQTIALDFGFGGLDQKSDDKLVIRTKLVTAQDVRFNKLGRIDRRNPDEAVGTLSTTVTRLIKNNDSLFAFTAEQDTRPVVRRIDSSDRAFASPFNQSTVSRLNRAPMGEIVAAPVSGYQYSSTPAQVDRADGYDQYCIVHHQGSATGTITVEIYDSETNICRYSSALGLGTHARVVAHPKAQSLTNNEFLFVYQSTTTLNLRHILSNSTTQLFTTLGGTADTSWPVTGSKFDVMAYADDAASTSAVVFVAASETVGVNLGVFAWPTVVEGGGFSLSSTVINSSETVTRLCLANTHNPSHTALNVRLFWCESTGGLLSATYNHSRTVVLAPASVTTTTTTPVTMTGCQLSDGTAHLFTEYAGATTTGNYVRAWVMNTSNTPVTATGEFTLGSMSLASKASAKTGDGYCQFWGCYPALNQNTMFLFSSSYTSTEFGTAANGAASIGRLFHTVAQGTIADSVSGIIPNLQCVGNELRTITSALRRVVSGTSAADTEKYNFYGVVHSDSRGLLSSQGKNEAIVTGGYISAANGTEGLIPLGSQLFPIITVTPRATGDMVAGTYAFSGVFEFTDSSGRVYRSAPAEPKNVTLTTTQSVTGVVYDYSLPDGMINNARFVAYRTLVNESHVYYRCSDISTAGGFTNGGSITLPFTVTIADATVAAKEPLYITGGVFDNWQPSAPIAIASNGRRFLSVSGDRPTFVVESKPTNDRDGLAFFENVGRDIVPGGNRIYGLASYLDKWFAFKKSVVFVAQGDGADVTGQNDTLSEFQPISNGVGCTQPRSIVTTSVGVAFRSSAGFYLIGSDLVPRYVGAAVENFTSSVVDSAYDNVNEIVHFALSDGTVLVMTIFETEQGVDIRWSEDLVGPYLSEGAAAIAVVDGIRYFAPSTVSSTAIFRDTGTFNGLGNYRTSKVSTYPADKVRTAWVPMSAIQGFGRVWKASVLGVFDPVLTGADSVTYSQFASSNTVIVAIGYDGEAAWSETHTMNAASFKQNTLSGENNAGASFEITPRRQRCSSMRFEITQSYGASGTFLPGFQLNQIQLEVGIKPGNNRLPASARARKS